MQGYIKIHRKIKQWQHYKEPAIKAVFVDLLLDAAHKPTWQSGVRLAVGECISSTRTLAANNGLAAHTVTKALNLLIESGEIARRRVGNTTIFKILKYADYQDKSSKSVANGNTPKSGVAKCDTPPHCNITIKKDNNNLGGDMRVRAQERVDNLRCQVLDSWSVEQACYINHITEEQYKQLTEEIFSDWLFALDESKPAQPQLDEINKKHFLAVMRIKAQILVKSQRNGTENIQSNRDIQRRGVDTKAVKSEDYDTAF